MADLPLPLHDEEPWTPTDETLGARLAMVRWRMGWNVKEAADACGFNNQSWHNWEHGGHPRDYIAVCQKIAAESGCSMRWLVGTTRNWKQLRAADLGVITGDGATPSGTRKRIDPNQQELPMRRERALRAVPDLVE